MSTKFNLIRIDLKRVDGTGDVIHARYSPAALIQTARYEREQLRVFDNYERALWQAYFCVKNSGLLAEIMPGRGSDEDKFDRLWSEYAFAQVALDDDGNPVDEEEDEETEDEENPTGTNS